MNFHFNTAKSKLSNQNCHNV